MKIDSLRLLIAIQFATLAVLFLDVPIIRQVMVFAYLSFLPGFLVLKILKMDVKSRIDTILLSVGLSVAFLMLLGLVVNRLYPIAGVTQPLSTVSLSITIGIALLSISLVSYKGHSLSVPSSLPNSAEIFRVILFFVIPFLAILGAWSTSSRILLLMVTAVSLLVMLTGLSERLIPSRLYPVVLIAVALSLLFPIAFISMHLVGYDIFGEFYVFRLTQINSWWNAGFSSSVSELLDYNGMLSVTVLPTIYSNLLNVSGEWVFKIAYLFFYSLVPIVLYQTYRGSFGKSAAFLSAFYFVLFPRFYMEERRQIIGELFLVLLLFSILNKDLSPRKRQILVVIFGGALVISHYSISYIFLFSVLLAWIITSIMRLFSSKRQLAERRVLTTSLVLLIVIFNVSWYVFVTPNLGLTFQGFIEHVVTSFSTGFASVQSRGEMVSDFVSPNLGNLSLVSKADYLINKIPYGLILVGFAILVMNRKKISVQFEYLPMAFASLAILIMALVLPAFAPAFLAHRFFHVALIFLAPVCILGGTTLLKWILKPFMKMKDSSQLCIQIMCIFLIVIFLFKVGFVSEVTGDPPVNLAISFTRMRASHSPVVLDALYESYVPQQDVNSATWFSNFALRNPETYADEISRKHVLAAYGSVIIDWSYILQRNTTINSHAYVYLRYFNHYGFITVNEGPANAAEVTGQLDLTNKIYTNGDSEIYRIVSKA